MSVGDRVESHYASEDIARRILAALRAEIGPDAPITPDALAPLDHFHGRGVLATRELVAMLDPRPGEAVLDIGCGIGGPARWIADKTGCRVTGVDLTEAFVAAAAALNAATGMSGRVAVRQASALDLPFPDASFDRAYSQNVVMNIADKARFYGEAHRVLKPGGVLALSNGASGASGPPYFPVPWAESAETSFLSTVEETRRDIEAAGFAILRFHDATDDIRAQVAAQRKKAETRGQPRLGLHVLMGERMWTYLANSQRSIEDGRVRMIEVLAKKAG
ncbi:MAG: methyltransferase domain-containing protein [Alphaproteobacteria bacterium]|nr:methyltransferase domain-containing protein [Alphaproteobacteria bacterium]